VLNALLGEKHVPDSCNSVWWVRVKRGFPSTFLSTFFFPVDILACGTCRSVDESWSYWWTYPIWKGRGKDVLFVYMRKETNLLRWIMVCYFPSLVWGLVLKYMFFTCGKSEVWHLFLHCVYYRVAEVWFLLRALKDAFFKMWTFMNWVVLSVP